MRSLLSFGVCLSVYLSVRLSVTLVYCIHTAEDIVKLLVRPGSRITLVFWHHVPISNSKGNPFSGDAKYTGWEKLSFSTEITVYLGNGASELGPWLSMERTNIGTHWWRIDLCRFRWPWLTFDPVSRSQHFFEVECLKNDSFLRTKLL